MAWFTREKTGMDEGSGEGEKRLRTEGLWLKCDSCGQIIWKKALDENLQCCPKCEFHFRIDARTRLGMLFDDGFEEFDTGMTSCDPLHLDEAYGAKLATAREATQLSDALLSASGALDGRRVNICAMEWKFMGGSMGAVVGEKITRAVERSAETGMPLVIISASGGARMQEGTISLMQLAKISAALMRAGRAHRLRRPARDRADHPPEASRRFPAQRVPAGTRVSRRRGQTFGHEGVHRPQSPVLLRLNDSTARRRQAFRPQAPV